MRTAPPKYRSVAEMQPIRERVKQLVLQGRVLKEISDAVGLETTYVQKIVKDQLGFQRMLVTPEEAEMIRKGRT